MDVRQGGIEGLLIFAPRRIADSRGWFAETWNTRVMKTAGVSPDFVQDNHSFSAESGTLRGLHYQAPPHAQDKLIRCTSGAILDATVDVRTNSATFGKSFTIELSAENGEQLFVPSGFLHGFVTLTPDTQVQYKVSDFYDPACDGCVRWNSAGVEWGLKAEPVISEKDRTATVFEDWQSPFSGEPAQ